MVICLHAPSHVTVHIHGKNYIISTVSEWTPKLSCTECESNWMWRADSLPFCSQILVLNNGLDFFFFFCRILNSLTFGPLKWNTITSSLYPIKHLCGILLQLVLLRYHVQKNSVSPYKWLDHPKALATARIEADKDVHHFFLMKCDLFRQYLRHLMSLYVPSTILIFISIINIQAYF